jgi:hypothetical protein
VSSSTSRPKRLAAGVRSAQTLDLDNPPLPSMFLVRPSPRTLRTVALASVVGSVFWAWALWPRFSSGVALPECSSLVALGLGSIAYGTALGVAYTSLSLLLDFLFRRLIPEKKRLESTRQALPLAFVLFALQAAIVGGIAVAGALPAAWPWWLGIYGALLT